MRNVVYMAHVTIRIMIWIQKCLKNRPGLFYAGTLYIVRVHQVAALFIVAQADNNFAFKF